MRLKKAICSVLSVVLFLSTLAPCAYASSFMSAEDYSRISTTSLTKSQIEQYDSEMSLLSSVGWQPEMFSIYSIDNSKFVYKIALSDESISYVEVFQDALGRVVMDIYEGTRHNTIVYLNDGVIVDGFLYKQPSATAVSVDFSNSQNTRARYSSYSKTPQWGTPYDQYYYWREERDNNFNIERELVHWTTIALCAVIGVRFFPNMGYSASIVYGLIGDALDDLIQNAITHPMANNSNYISYRITYYEHEDSWSMDHLYRCIAFFYPVPDCDETGGEVSTTTYYYNNYFS